MYKELEIEDPLLGVTVVWRGLIFERDVDFDLVELTGMDRAMHVRESGEGGLKASHAGRSAGRGAVVQDTEHPAGVAIGRLGHHLGNKTMEGFDADG